MKNSKITKFIIWIIGIIFLASNISTMQVYASSNQKEEQKTVRVGYLFAEGYQSGGDDEPKAGFGYEYYQEISYYTNWKYEYVYAGFADCLEMLENGEIDIMGDLSYTPERAEKIDFSTVEQGKEEYYVYTRFGHPQIVPGDYTTLNGMRIAVSKGSYQAELFEQWCKEKGIECTLVPYDDAAKRTEAVNTGEVDATLSALITTRNENNEYWQSVVKFGSSPFYFGVNKDRPDLLKELNEAMTEIQSMDPYFNDKVYQRNVTGEALRILELTDEEKDWIQNKGSLTIGCLADYAPFCYQGGDTDKLEGVFPEVFRFISENQNINFEYKTYKNYDELFDALNNEEIDAIVPVYSDYWVAEQENICILDGVTDVGATLLYRDSKLTLDEMTSNLAVCKNSLLGEYYQKIYYPDAQVQVCDTTDECYDMLKQGKVNAILIDDSIPNHSEYKREIEKNKLYTIDLSKGISVSIAVRKGNVMLLNILSKGLNLVPDSVISGAMLLSSNDMREYTFEDFVRDHIIQVVLIGLLIICLFFALILWQITTKLKLKQAEVKSERDGLTGFYNKQTGYAIIEEILKQDDKKHAMMIFDIDDFKSANDTFGHAFGDKVLKIFAERLLHSTRSNDILVRIGGDEFLAFLTYEGDIKSISERITRQINGKIDDFELSCSIGVVTTDQAPRKYEQLFECADSMLYEVKRNGKNGYRIYS